MATDVLTASSAAPPNEGGVVNPRPVSLEHTDSVVLPAWPAKCDFVVKEILKTEHDYVNSLEDILKGYKNPLAGHLQSTNEGHNFVTTVFCNLEQLYEIHRSLLERLKFCEAKPHEFGQAFSSAIEEFKEYTKYCTNYVKALQCLQQWLTTDKDLKSFIEECQHSLHHDMPLNFLLIKPVQRILKYHLLLKDLLKHFDQNHDGYNSLRRAYGSMVEIANHINEVQRRHDYDRKVQEIQSCLSGLGGRMPEGNLSAYGDLLHEGMCKVGKKGAERHVLLFEKLLLILKKKDAKHYTYKGHILRDELSLVDDTHSGGSHVFKVFSQHHRSQSYAIHTNTTLAKQEWVGKISLLKARQLKEEESFEQPVKRRKVDAPTVSEQQETRLRDPKMHLASSRTKRVTPRKKKERRDVRSLFSRDEGAPELTSFKRVAPDSLTSIPEDRTTVEVEVSFPAQTTEDSGFMSSVAHSKSVDSCLSLSDVEIGLEDSGHFGEFDEVDSPHVVEMSPHVPQQKSNLKRRTTIRVKRASRVNPPLKALLAWEPKEDEPVDMIDGENFEEEDSQVKGLSEMGFDSPGDSVLGGTSKGFSQGQSVDGIPNGIMENGQGSQEVPSTVNQSQQASGSADGGEEIFPEAATIPVSMEGEEEQEEEEGDFVIMEDSSDSEDEEEEDESLVEDVTVDLGTSVDKEDIADNELQKQTDTLEGHFEATDREVPKEGANVLTDMSLSTLDERAVPSEGEGIQSESAALKPEADEQEDTVTMMETPPRSGMGSLAFKGVTDIYGTVPRKQYRKSTSPHPNPPSTIDSTRRSGSAYALSQTTPDAQSRRALRFSQLLEFTKQQCSPVQNLKSVNVTESLPILGQRPFSPEREEERMTVPDESTTLFLESKKLEFSEQGDVEGEVPKVTHIKPSVEVEEPDFQAEKQEFPLTTVDSKEADMETESSTDATTTGNAVAAERENLEEDKNLPTPAPNASGPEYELRMRSQSQQNQLSATENHLTPKLNGEQTMTVEPSGGVSAFIRRSHRGGLWPSMLYWGLVIVGIGIAVYLGYSNYAYSSGGASKPL